MCFCKETKVGNMGNMGQAEWLDSSSALPTSFSTSESNNENASPTFSPVYGINHNEDVVRLDVLEREASSWGRCKCVI